MLDLWRKDLSRIGADLLPVLANSVTEGLDDEAPIRSLCTLFLGICVFAGAGLNQAVFSWKEGLVWLHTSAILF